MLNELFVAERGARQAGLRLVSRHPDVKDAKNAPTLHVYLDERGHIAAVRPVSRKIAIWTLRDGQHNSFPFTQPKPPLLELSPDDERVKEAIDRRSPARRTALAVLCSESRLHLGAFADWPGTGLISRLRERRLQLASLRNTTGTGVLETIDRFLLACDGSPGHSPTQLLEEVVRHLGAGLEQTADSDWCDVAAALLVGTRDSKTNTWLSAGALLFDARGDWRSIYDAEVEGAVSSAMNAPDACAAESRIGCCAITGESGRLVPKAFPQPKLPVLGQTYLFARNKDTPANDRYGRFSADSMPVGQNTVVRLAAAIRALTAKEREGITWRSIPGESSTHTDLLLAFVDNALDAPVTGLLADEDDVDLAEEAPATTLAHAGQIAAFEKRTERLIEAIQGKAHADSANLPVHLVVFRKLDPANRKVAYAATPTVKELHEAAVNWAEGERNVAPWMTLPVETKARRFARIRPPHVAPLGLIGFARQLFLRGGTQRQDAYSDFRREEAVGLPASEALALFIAPMRNDHDPAHRRVLCVLRLVLARRGQLLVGTAHASRLGLRKLKAFDRHEALRTVTVLAVLLHKIGRKENYMSDPAFTLGQLLASADTVHAGYCADVRGGALPPSLLGNQVLTMAQTAPVKALAALCRRWKPYDGWARKTAQDRSRVDALVASKDTQGRGWAIRTALRHARDMRVLAETLAPALASCKVDDVFRAELLLGYIAGLPAARDDRNGTDGDSGHKEQED